MRAHTHTFAFTCARCVHRWFLEAAKHDVSVGEACYNLAIFCEDGRGGEEASTANALSYLRRASAANYTDAARVLAQRLLLDASTGAVAGRGRGGGTMVTDIEMATNSERASHAHGAEDRVVEAHVGEEEAMALLRRAADVQGAADVESMTLLAAHLARARRKGGVEGQGSGAPSDAEAVKLYAEAIARGVMERVVHVAHGCVPYAPGLTARVWEVHAILDAAGVCVS